MATSVEWLKFKVGMFDGSSFKKIKRAKIDGVVDFRDKLTALWFELIDLAGKVNNNGYYFNDEIAYTNFEEISIMIDRTEHEVKMCIDWFVKNDMMEIIDNHLLLSNFIKYQNEDGLLKIQEQNRKRQQDFRERKKHILLENKNDNVSVTLRNANPLISISNINNNSIDKEYINNNKKVLKDEINIIKEVIDYLNYKVGSKYRYNNSANNKLISAREKDGFTLDDFKYVIDVKASEWLKDDDMVKYLRPQTLFTPKNFESYLNQKPKKSSTEKSIQGAKNWVDIMKGNDKQ